MSFQCFDAKNQMQSFNQATAMTRFYAKPMLLIEFDSNKPFALQVQLIDQQIV